MESDGVEGIDEVDGVDGVDGVEGRVVWDEDAVTYVDVAKEVSFARSSTRLVMETEKEVVRARTGGDTNTRQLFSCSGKTPGLV